MVFLSEESLPRRTGVGLGTGWLGRLTLCLALFAALTVSAVQAQTITTPTLGKGTSEEPYQINKLGHLAWLSAQAALTTNTACYKMTANIDASATANWDAGVLATPALKHGFTPIGNSATPFLGTFDGNGHRITGLTINRPTSSYVGLFGYSEGVVKNLTLKKAAITGRSRVGGIVGQATSATLTNLHFAGTVAGTLALTGAPVAGSSYSGSYIGGVVGFANATDISDCTVSGKISGMGYDIGGLVGELEYYSTLTNSTARAVVTATGSGDYAAGLAGKPYGNSCVGGLVGRAYNNTEISDCFASGKVTGTIDVGGLVGYAYNSTIAFSSAQSKVSGDESVGGLVGELETASVGGCTAMGTVSGSENVGGVVGNAYDGTTILFSTATCLVTGTASSLCIGGLVGETDTTQIAFCTASGKVKGFGDVGGLVGYTDATELILSGSSATVSGVGYIGGLVGEADNDAGVTSDDATQVLFCSATGDVSGCQDVGGLIGHLYHGAVGYSAAIGDVTGSTNIGGLIGVAYYKSELAHSSAAGAVSGYTGVGGLVAQTDSDDEILACYATGDVSGDDYIGGLVGEVYGTTVGDCRASGAVTGTSNVGGLVGNAALSTITDSNACGGATGNSYVGGFVGRDIYSEILRCYATGHVRGKSQCGGLVGVSYPGCTIENSYARGAVSGNFAVGGLLGMDDYTSNYDSASTKTVLNACYSTGKVTGPAALIGGLTLAGSSISVTTTSYWNTQTSGVSSPGFGEGRTTGQMQTESTFTNWDFSNVWSMDSEVNNGYPYLQSDENTSLNGLVVLTSFTLNNGATSTTCRTVTLDFVCSNRPDYYMASESPSFTGADWQSYSGSAPTFTLSSSNGGKRVYFKVKSFAGKTSKVLSDSILLYDIPVLEHFRLNHNQLAVTTATATVHLNNVYRYAGSEALQYMASESPTFSGASWASYTPGVAPTFTLSTKTLGLKTVYFKLRTAVSHGESNVRYDKIWMRAATSTTKSGASATVTATATTSARTKTLSGKTTAAVTGSSLPTVGSPTTDVTSSTTLAADLQAEAYTLAALPDGSGYAGTLTVINNGTADAGAFHVALYLWADATTCLADAVLVQEVAVNGLAAGAETTSVFGFALPNLGEVVCPVFVVDNQSEVAAYRAANLLSTKTLLTLP